MEFWNFPYIRWHIIFVILPSIIIWTLYWRYLIKYKQTIIWIAVLSFIWGIIFDWVASPILKLWFFDNNLGVYFLGLPIEEYLFLIFVPQELTAILLLIRKNLKHG